MATRTAMPSANVALLSQSTGCPASTLSAITGASFATTPLTRPTPRCTPMMSAPLPTGTITVAGGRPSCRRISSPIASYPSNCAGSAPSSKNGRSFAVACSRARSFDSSRSAPTECSSAPSCSRIATFASLDPSGTNTTARMPVRSAAHAAAAPWLPVEAVTTASAPPARYFSSAGRAPRHLKAPSS